VDHAVDAFFKFHECTVSGEVADGAFDGCADREASLDGIPWVGVELTHAEGDLLFLDADAENDGLDFLTDGKNIARASDALDPAELGNVDETFDAFFDLAECTVREQFGDLAADACADREAGFDVGPWVLGHLLEAEGYALFVAVHFEDKHFERLADVEHFAGVVDAAPGHVGDVKQAVHAFEIDECAEVGDVFDGADDFVVGGNGAKEALTLLAALSLDDFATGENDVFALVVDFDDLEFVDLADVFVEIFWWNDVHL